MHGGVLGGFSEEIRVMLRPFHTYRALAGAGWPERPARAAIFGPRLLLLVVGGFVSLTAMGRLVLAQVGFTMLFWAFGPALQIAALAIALRASRAGVALPL